MVAIGATHSLEVELVHGVTKRSCVYLDSCAQLRVGWSLLEEDDSFALLVSILSPLLAIAESVPRAGQCRAEGLESTHLRVNRPASQLQMMLYSFSIGQSVQSYIDV